MFKFVQVLWQEWRSLLLAVHSHKIICDVCNSSLHDVRYSTIFLDLPHVIHGQPLLKLILNSGFFDPGIMSIIVDLSIICQYNPSVQPQTSVQYLAYYRYRWNKWFLTVNDVIAIIFDYIFFYCRKFAFILWPEECFMCKIYDSMLYVQNKRKSEENSNYVDKEYYRRSSIPF